MRKLSVENLKNYLPIILAITFVLVLVGGLSLRNTDKETDESKVQVSTSFYPLYFFASEIGGDKADVTNITPAGVEPHDYEPTAKEIAAIYDSQLLILNGGVVSWADSILEDKENNKSLIIETRDSSGIGQDPHTWLDPILAKSEVNRILEGYKEIDSKNAAYYEANAQRLNQKLDDLDEEYLIGLKSCRQKNIVTAHASFGHLATRYGLTQLAINGISPDEEPSAQKLAEVSDFVRENNIQYIFFEELVNPEFSETIALEANIETLVLDPIEGISQEKLEKGDDYFTLMRDNLINLQLALECEQ
jgi:zinc transport system substrate-binding protein